MPETLIIELRDASGGAVGMAGPPRPPQLGPSYQQPAGGGPAPAPGMPGIPETLGGAFLAGMMKTNELASMITGGWAAQMKEMEAGRRERGPETTLLGPIKPAVNDLVLGLREARVGLGRFGNELVGAGKEVAANPFFTRQRAALLAGTASQAVNTVGGGFGAQALGGMANIAGAFAIGGPLFGALTAFTSALRLGTEWLRMWREKVQEATEALRPFAPQLTRQTAVEEAKTLRQDIERAKRLDDVLANFVRSQGELDRARKDYEEKRLREAAVRESRVMDLQADVLKILSRADMNNNERFALLINSFGALIEGTRGIARHVREIAEKGDTGTTDDFLKQLDEMARLPTEAGDPGPRDPDRRLRFPPLGAAGGV